MKKLLVVLTVLAMATVANAVTKISVNGQLDVPDTQIVLMPSQEVVIDIHSWTTALTILLMQGPATLTKGPNMYLWEQTGVTLPSVAFDDYKALFTDMGYGNITAIADVDILDTSDPFTQPAGRVVDGLILHCEDIGDVTLTLFDANLNVLDSQVIHQIPEPVTFALLGLGGLFLRRRK